MKECPLCRRCLDDQHDFCPEEAAPLDPIFPGPVVIDGKYHLLRSLGAGGMGRVYRARHLGLKRLVAVKIPRRGHSGARGFVARFRREAEALGRLRHPHIVAVTDFGVDRERDIPYLVMELLEGRSLAERLRSSPLPLEEALELLRQVAAAVDHAHAEGILHRDLKPSNIFLAAAPGGGEQAKVLDFGLASFWSDLEATPAIGDLGTRPATDATTPVTERLLSPPDAPGTLSSAPSTSASTSALGRTPLGTPAYVSPEVLRKEAATPASDLYACGVLAHLMLTGALPFRGTDEKVLQQHLERRAPAISETRPELGPEIDAPVLAALAKDPHHRPTSAAELADRLEAAGEKLLRRRRDRRSLPRRLAISTLVAILATLVSGVLGTALAGFEQQSVDVRLSLMAERPPTQPLLIVRIDEESLEADPRPLADRADEFSAALAAAIDQGALGVGIDLLLPTSWGASDAFSDLVLAHHENLVLAAFSTPDGAVIGPESIGGLTTAALGARSVRELFGFVNLDDGPDGVVRFGRTRYEGTDGRERPSFAARSAAIMRRHLRAESQDEVPRRFRLDFSIDRTQIESLSWSEFLLSTEQRSEAVEDRFVLLGATYPASGDSSIPIPPHRSQAPVAAGVMIQGLAIHTLLDGVPLRDVAAPAHPLLAAGLAFLGSAVTLLVRRRRWALLAAATVIAAWCLAAFGLLAARGLVLPMLPPVLAALVAVAASWAWRLGLLRPPERPPDM